MTIGTQLLKFAAFLVSLLTVMRGRLLYYVVRYGSAEYYAQIATASIQSNSRVITRPKASERPYVPSLKNISLPYSNPNELVHDILRGRVGCDTIRLSEWLELVCMAMIDGRLSNLNIDIPYGGGLYSLHHCVKQIHPPESVDTIKERLQ